MLRGKLLTGAIGVVLIGMLLTTALFASYSARMASLCEEVLGEYNRNSYSLLKDSVWNDTFEDLDSFVDNFTNSISTRFEEITAKTISLADSMPTNYYSVEVNDTIAYDTRSLLTGSLNGSVDGLIRGNMSAWLDGRVRGEMWGAVDGEFTGRVIVPEGVEVTGTYNGDEVIWGNGTYEISGYVSLNALAVFDGDFRGRFSGRYSGSMAGLTNGTVENLSTVASINATFAGTMNLLPRLARDAFLVLSETNLVYRTYYGTENGVFISSDDSEFAMPFIGTFGYDHRIREWYRGGLDGVYLSGVYVDAGGAGLMITLSAPVVRDGSVIGVVGVDITLRDLVNFTANMDLLGCGYLMMVDSSGGVIAHPEIEAMQYNATLWKENVATENLNMSAYPEVRNITQVPSGVIRHFYLNVTEQDVLNYSPASATGEYFVSYARTERFGIIVIGVLSAEVAYKKLDILEEEYEREFSMVREKAAGEFYIYTSMYIASIAAAVILTVLFVGLIVRSMLSPLEDLTRIMGEVSKGKIDQKVPRHLVERDDEIGELARSFRRMLNTIGVLLREVEEE